MALHWLDRPAFYKEVERVLKPEGVLAAFGYNLANVLDGDAHKCTEEFYNDIPNVYCDEEVHHVRNLYIDIELPFADCMRMETETVSIRQSMTVDSYIGWLSTLGSWREYLKTHPGSDELTKVEQKLKAIYKSKTGEENAVMNVVFPGYMLIGRKAT